MWQNYRTSHFIIGWFNTQMFYQLRRSALLEFHLPIRCEHKYWNSCLTGLSKWSAVSSCINSSDIKSRECVVSVISIAFLHSMTTHTNQDENEGADFERKASNLDAKRKEEVNKSYSKNKGHGEIKSLENTGDISSQQWPDRLRKTTVVNDRQIIKAVKMNPKRRVCKITNNFQKAGVMLWQSTVLRRLWHRITDATARCKPLTSTNNRKARLAKKHKGEPLEFWNWVLWTDETSINLY